MNKNLNVLSLFDGISCGQVALTRCGIEYNDYYASEIEPYAMKVANANFPDMIQLGDVLNWREWDIDWSSIGIIFAGFPCQSFSFAGNQGGLDDPRGKLLFTLIDIWNECKKHNPDVLFLFENTRMKQDVLETINDLIGFEPVKINSNLVSAQSRVRYYWTNMTITQPEDEGINIEDILIDGDYPVFDVADFNPKECRNYFQFDVSGKGYKSQQDRMYKTTGKFGCIPNARAVTKIKIALNPLQYRNLTLMEVERLQTLPDGYTQITDGFSLDKSLSAIGNGWNIETITHILNLNIDTLT